MSNKYLELKLQVSTEEYLLLGGCPQDLLRDLERSAYIAMDKMCRGNTSKIARLLGVSRNTAKAKLTEYVGESRFSAFSEGILE